MRKTVRRQEARVGKEMKGNREALWQIQEVCQGMKDTESGSIRKRGGGGGWWLHK